MNNMTPITKDNYESCLQEADELMKKPWKDLTSIEREHLKELAVAIELYEDDNHLKIKTTYDGQS